MSHANTKRGPHEGIIEEDTGIQVSTVGGYAEVLRRRAARHVIVLE